MDRVAGIAGDHVRRAGRSASFLTPHDTIAAISTPPGRGGIGIVRLSGANSRAFADVMLRPAPDWRSWRQSRANLIDAEGNVIDEVVVSYHAAPRSYTAEDVVEIACHGSPVILRACLDRLLNEGVRLADPGEFTLRAFLNGRLDLPRAEAVRDLIEATTLYQAKVAAQQVSGSVSRRLAPIKKELIDLISLLEAGIDFAEDDIGVASDAEILSRLDPIHAGFSQMAASFAFGKFVHHGVTLAIVGEPNVGKSSLFNALLGRERAIVTDIPGTTRDTVSETAAIEGIPVRLVDTAGLRESSDLVESLGIERSYQAMVDADVTLVVLDLSRADGGRPVAAGCTIVVGNKCDLPRASAAECLPVSAKTGAGLDELRKAILAAVAPAIEREEGFITSLRHERLLREAVASLARAREAVAEKIPHEMLLIDLYSALKPIDAITGATTADDILNNIFSTFCIGK